MADSRAGSTRPAPGRRSPVVWVVATAGALAIAYLFRGLVLPLLLAVFVAYLLHPLVVWAEGFAIKRTVAVTALFVLIAVFLVGGWLALGPHVRAETVALAGSLPSLADRIDEALGAAARQIGAGYPALRRFLPKGEGRQGWVDRLLEGRTGTAGELLKHAGAVFITVVLVPVFTFFLLRDSGGLIAFVMDRLPPAHIETTVAGSCEIERIIGRYLRGVALDGIAVGILASVGLWLLGVPYSTFLGAFAGLANAVPFLGPLLGGGAASLAMLIHTHRLEAVAGVALLFLGIKIVDDAVIQPLTIGRSLHLHPVLLLASVVAGNQAFGILGMVLAVPAVTVLQEVTRLLIEHRHTLAGTHRPAVGEPAALPRCVC